MGLYSFFFLHSLCLYGFFFFHFLGLYGFLFLLHSLLLDRFFFLYACPLNAIIGFFLYVAILLNFTVGHGLDGRATVLDARAAAAVIYYAAGYGIGFPFVAVVGVADFQFGLKEGAVLFGLHGRRMEEGLVVAGFLSVVLVRIAESSAAAGSFEGHG